MSYQLRGLQVSLVIHVSVFALITGLSISAVNLSRPILIEFGIIEGTMDGTGGRAEKSHAPQQKKTLIKSTEEKTLSRRQNEPEKTRVEEQDSPFQTREELLPIKKEAEEQHNEQIAPALSDTQVPIAATGASSASSDMRNQSAGQSLSSAEGIVSAGSKPVSGVFGGEASGGLQFGGGAGPTFLHRVLPVYPAAAKRIGKEGKVVVKLSIDEKGNLFNIEVIERTGDDFAEAAMDALRHSTFLPAKMDGKPVASKAMLTIRFTMKKDR
jgi:protein TonB